MKSTLEIIDNLYAVVNVADVKAAITGEVRKNQRPVNSKKIDIVIGCLPTNNLQIQTAVLNINIHVPNLVTTTTDGQQDFTQPDYLKLRSLTALVISKVTDQWKGDYWFDVESQAIYPDQNNNSHYSNIRVKFYSNNI